MDDKKAFTVIMLAAIGTFALLGGLAILSSNEVPHVHCHFCGQSTKPSHGVKQAGEPVFFVCDKPTCDESLDQWDAEAKR